MAKKSRFNFPFARKHEDKKNTVSPYNEYEDKLFSNELFRRIKSEEVC